MGFFQSIADTFWGSAARRAQGRYRRQAAQQSIYDVEAQQLWRSGEDPREQAHQKQSMFSRGIGKSSMARQEGARLGLQQSQRNTKLSQQHQLAKFYKLYIDRQTRYEEISSYLSLADGILGIFTGNGNGSPFDGSYDAGVDVGQTSTDMGVGAAMGGAGGNYTYGR